MRVSKVQGKHIDWQGLFSTGLEKFMWNQRNTSSIKDLDQPDRGKA